MTKRMRANVDFLSDLQHASPGGKRSIIRQSTQPQISTLNEISKNVLQRRIKLNPKQRQQLSRYRNLMRKMADKKIPYQRKKKMIGGQLGLIPLLLSVAAPFISKLIKRR
jgi:hypothetical protein